MNDRNYGSEAAFVGCPKDYPDPLVDDGSLFLLHMPLSHTVSTPPVNGTVLQNLAWAQAAAQIGSGDAASLAALVTIPGTTTNDEIKLEVTGKKGIHGIVSLTTNEQNDNVIVSVPAVICEHIRGKLATDLFYVSAWWRVTRQAAQASGPVFQMGGAAVGDYHSKFLEGSNQPSIATDREPVLNASNEALGNSIRTVGRTGFTGTIPGVNGLGAYFMWGTYSSAYQNKSASRILYRLHIKNLTTSGKTWAQEDALEFAAYTAAFSAGGEFYNDTFTDPSTVA